MPPWFLGILCWTSDPNQQLDSQDQFYLHKANSYTSLTGREGDISNLFRYKWYYWLDYIEHKEHFPVTREVLGRGLGPATGAGNDMEQWLLKSSGSVVPRRTLRPLHVNEIHSPEEQKKRNIFGALIEIIWGTSINPPPVSTTSNEDIWEEHEDEDESDRIIPNIKDTIDDKGRQLNQHLAYNKLINAEFQLQHENEMRYYRFKKRSLNPGVQTTGSYEKNQMLKSIIYEVEFED